jgi:ATPase subunit of ABC transporter with duplicated ATPase domains
VNALVLDEPTNDLDLEAIEQLELALSSFEGSAVLVTHDRRFLEAFGATQTLDLSAAPAVSPSP